MARESADLLTASLTGVPSVSLVERDEVGRVFGEQSLIAAKPNDFARLGQLLRADGLVVLQPVASDRGTSLAVRLAAVNSGVVLDAALYPLPLRDASEWADMVARQFTRLLPKLEVTRNQAVPISFLNLRSAVNTPASVQTERSLSALLYHRLMSEPELFVLERREIGRLQWEKELAGPDSGEFWNGSYLLEGVIDRDGGSSEKVTVHARLTPPGQKTPIELAVSGPRRKSVDVVELLAREILGALHRQPSVTAWNPDAEAGRYQEEAAWAMRWGMWPEANSAADTAFSLGRHTEEVAGMQVRSLLEQSRTGEAFEFSAARRIGWAENEPSREVLPNALEAIETYLTHCRTTDLNRWMTNAPWIDLGIESLQVAARVLRHHYFYGYRQNLLDPKLVELRQAARELVGILPSDAHRASPRMMFGEVGPNPRPMRFYSNPTFPVDIDVYTLAEVVGRYGAVWQESPQQAIAMYRDLMNTGGYGRERESILLRPWQQPWWVGWTRSDRIQGKELWKDFITQLRESTNDLDRAEGALLVLQASETENDITNAASQFIYTVFDTNRERFTTNVNFAVLDDFDNLLRRKCKANLLPTLRWEDPNGPAPTIDRWLVQWQSLSFPRLIHYLQTATVHDVNRAGWPVAKLTFTTSQAKELLPVMEAYSVRFPRGDYVRSILEKLRDQASKVEGQTNSVPSPAPTVASSKPLNTPVLQASTNALYVTKAWFPHITEEQAKFDSRRAFLELRERGGRLYAMVPYSRQVRIKNGGYTSMFYESFRSIVEFDLRNGGYRAIADGLVDETLTPLRYEIAGDGLYWMEDEPVIKRLDLKSGQRKEFPLPLSLTYNTHLTSAGSRLFVVSPEYIGELDTKSGALQLLASVRRRPAANDLDSWSWRGVPAIFTPNGEALTAVFTSGYSVCSWRYSAQDQSWKQVSDYSGQGTRSYHNGNYLFFSPRFSVCLDQVARADGSFETLLTDDDTLLPRWQIPFNFPAPPDPGFAHGMQHAYDGTNLWILVPPIDLMPDSRLVRRTPQTDRHNTLLWFSPESEMPAEIPLWFEPQPPFSPPEAKYVGGTPEIIPTRHGILLTFGGAFSRADIASIWFVDWTDLESWRSRHQPRRSEIPRRAPEMRRRFDQNGDGKLDATELAQMQSDQDWKKENLERDAMRLLLTFDSDKDELLSGTELQRLSGAKFQIAMPTEQMRVLASRNRFIQPAFYDKNQDQSLDLKELLTLINEFTSPPKRTPPGPGMRPPGFPRRPSPTASARTNTLTTMERE